MSRYSIPAIAWFIISVVLLTLPGSAFPNENWLGDIYFDKWVHIGMFTMMVFLCCWAVYKTKKDRQKLFNYFLFFAITALVYGIIMEFVQKYYIPNRSFDIGDIIADGVGCIAGLLFSIRRFIKKN